MERLNQFLQFRDVDYFLTKKDNIFLFETVGPIMKAARLLQYKNSLYFDYTGYEIKAITTPCVSLDEVYGKKVCLKECPECTGTLLSDHALTRTAYVGVFWDSVKNYSKLPATYFWNDVNKLRILN